MPFVNILSTASPQNKKTKRTEKLKNTNDKKACKVL